jgi:hypothetical protein
VSDVTSGCFLRAHSRLLFSQQNDKAILCYFLSRKIGGL